MTNSVLVRRSESGLARKNSINLRDCRPENVKLDKTLSFKQWHLQDPVSLEHSVANNGYNKHPISPISLPEPASEITFFSPKPVNELDDAAVKLQKVYKSYRTRRNLADCAVVVEELWWKELDIAALKKDSVYFFDDEKPETALSKWARAGSRAAKVGKGLLKHEKAQKLALQHWLEAIDPRHRYGHNLHLFYDVWFRSESHEPFFYWLDVGGGKDVILDKCPRSVLHRQCIEYLGPKERKVYEVVVKSGKLVYRQSREPVNTIEGSKWIFVLSTTRALYVGQKKKGKFQHSSFLAGGATTAAGRLVVHDGVLEAVWPYSGHYHPTEEHFKEFIAFLEENQVDLTNVKMCAMDPVGEEGRMVNSHSSTAISPDASPPTELNTETSATLNEEGKITDVDREEKVKPIGHVDGPRGFSLADRLSRTWTTGAGPRIGCVRDYPTELQSRALEQVNLSPRMACGPFPGYGPIPSPRPSPKHRLSPRIMGLPSPRSPMSV